MKEVLIARSFVKPRADQDISISSTISALAVTVGVAFLVLTLGIYDSYVAKLETIVFSIYPHILLVDNPKLRGDREGEGDPPVMEALEDQLATCDAICAGQRIFFQDQKAGAAAATVRGTPIERFEGLTDTLRSVPGVVRLAPIILEEIPLSLKPEAATEPLVGSIRVLGVEAGGEAHVPQVERFVPPSLLRDLAHPTEHRVILSEELARRLFGDGDPAGHLLADASGRAVDLVVLGTFSLGFHSISRNMMLADLHTSQEILGMKDNVTYYGLQLSDPYAEGEAVHEVNSRLASSSLLAMSWSQMASSDFQSINLFRKIVFLVLGMSFVIIGLSIRNTLMIMIHERKKQIGVLRAMGLRDQSIRAVFYLISGSIGLLGTVTGVLIGVLLSYLFGYWLDQQLHDILPISGVEFHVSYVAIVQILTISLFACLLTAGLSVGQALRLDPVECLEEK